jgi:hypothetical protein
MRCVLPSVVLDLAPFAGALRAPANGARSELFY